MPAYAKGRTDTPLLEQTIGDRLEATASRLPDHEAVVMPHQNIRWTYRQLDDAVNRVARALLARGFEKGDRIGVC